MDEGQEAQAERRQHSGGPVGRRRLCFTIPLLAYVVLGLALTWPMAAHLATHVPGDGIDDPSLAWNLWWARHAFVDRPQNPFAVSWQFWPVGINLAFYTLTILNGLLAIPLQAVFGLVPAYNLLLLSSFVLGGFGAYLLGSDVLRAAGAVRGRANGDGAGSHEIGLAFAAWLGGALYAFASPKMFYAALGQGNIASSQWVPFAALYLWRAARPGGRPRDAALAALFMVLQAYAELTYASFLLIFGLMAALWGCVRSPGRFSGLRPLVGRFLVTGLLFLLGIAPYLANMLPDLRAEGDFFASGGGFADLFSADLVGYALPTQLHPILGHLVRAVANDSAPRPDGSHFPVDKGQQVYIGYVAAALAAVGLWRNRLGSGLRFWAAAALVFWLLTLGPSLRMAGYDTGVPLPFALVSRLPFFEGNRYPSRYSVMLLVSLAPLVARGLLTLHESVRSGRSRGTYARRAGQPLAWSVSGLLLAGLLFEHLSLPLPLSDLRVPALYDRIAAQGGDFAVLEIPPGWRNGARVAGKKDTVIMRQLWYQSQHGKRILGGNTSRNPEYKFQYFGEHPTLALLIALTNAADVPQHGALRQALAARPITDEDRARARDFAALLGIRFVMVHRGQIPPETEAALTDLLPLTLAGEADGLALYEVAGALPVPASFPLGDDRGRAVLGEGWSPSAMSGAPAGTSIGVYAQRAEARLLLPLPAAGTTLRLYMAGLRADQKMTAVVDGRRVGSQRLAGAPEWLAFSVPPVPDRPPLSDVRLRFSRLVPAAEIAYGPWPVGATGVASPASILVRSAGEETGDFAHIYVDGVDLAAGGRGYNLVALDGRDARLLGRAVFDTHADGEASARLAAWVAALPQGTIVAGAVRDEGSMNLSEEAVAALHSLGVAGDLRGRFRWGHAFIGAVGAPSGTAVEALDGIRTAQVSVGLPVSGPRVAAWLGEARVGE